MSNSAKYADTKENTAPKQWTDDTIEAWLDDCAARTERAYQDAKVALSERENRPSEYRLEPA